MGARDIRILVACEREGRVRAALRRRAFDAYSCDLEEAADGSPHHMRADVRDVIQGDWDVLIFHPVCRYLTNAGVKWLYRDGRAENGPCHERRALLEQAAAFYRLGRDAHHIPLRAIENPVMHGEAIRLTERGLGSVVQFVQPWWFGEPQFKATGWELFGLPKLVATNRLTPPKPGTEEHKRWSVVHRMPPGPDRERLRSVTPHGCAEAYADQWGAAALKFFQHDPRHGSNPAPVVVHPCAAPSLRGGG